mmetsp:Transcript_20412/g.33105  ORF Transcript_20412/g.33105 Transcript_20412/m.33105 type:complete len:259 (+) Transcript_20412:475-1251(+)
MHKKIVSFDDSSRPCLFERIGFQTGLIQVACMTPPTHRGFRLRPDDTLHFHTAKVGNVRTWYRISISPYAYLLEKTGPQPWLVSFLLFRRSVPELEKHFLEHACLGGERAARVSAQGGARLVEHREDVLSVPLRLVQKRRDLGDGGVLDGDHVLGQVLDEGEEAALGVEPGVRLELLVVRLERLDDARDAELEVALGAVQGADHQVDDAQVEALFVRVVVPDLLFLLFNFAHQVLRLLVLAGHDVCHAQVGQYNGGDL